MEKLLRLKDVLNQIPVSKSTWWAGIKKGIFPSPIYLTERTPVWPESEIDPLTRRNAGKTGR